MANKSKESVFIKLPDDIGTMSREEIGTWVTENLPAIQDKMKAKKKGADKE